MSLCHTPPPNRKMMLDRVGKQLVDKHGKQRHYTQPQIQSAATSAGYPIDVHCWVYCIFMSSDGFDEFHRSIGEICDYAAMKETMLTGIAGASAALGSMDGSWIDLPSVDLGGLFSWFSPD